MTAPLQGARARAPWEQQHGTVFPSLCSSCQFYTEELAKVLSFFDGRSIKKSLETFRSHPSSRVLCQRGFFQRSGELDKGLSVEEC